MIGGGFSEWSDYWLESTKDIYNDVGVKRGMNMILRFWLLVVTLLALYCGSALAVGLGEIKLKSTLNQRLDAEIILLNVGDLEQGEIITNLASQEDFDRLGASRDYNLTDLRFSARVREDGAHIVHITSSKAIIEPYLNFIVEAIWPTGRILREYIVLIDLPVFGTDGIEKIEPGRASGNASPAQQSGRSSNRREIPPAPSVSTGRIEGVITQGDVYGLTGPRDTLWAIASKVRPNNGISVQQILLALQRVNPEAFINNNINLLKVGQVLRIPHESEIRAASTEAAAAEVLVQNQKFEDYKSGDVTQLDARRTASNSSAGSGGNDDGELKLLAAGQSGARSGVDDARVGELENSLAVAREDLDRSRRANIELKARLDDIDGQLETLNELVKLKDDQLAALKTALQRQAEGKPTLPAVAVVTQPQSASSFLLNSLLSNPLVLGGIGVLLIGLVAGALIMFRRRRQDSSLEDEEHDFTEAMTQEDQPQLSLSDDVGEVSEADSEDSDKDVTQQTSDIISEAEIHIAYGRFPQAISFLQNAIENEPQRTDIQLRLLEVYVQTEDSTAFNLQYEQLKRLGDDEATRIGAELQAEIPGAAETSAAATDATSISSEPIAAIEEPGVDEDEDDLSFDLDDLDDLDAETDDDDLDAETDDDDLDAETAAGEELSLDETMALGDADLDLDAALEEVTAASEEEALDLALDDDDGLELGFDSLDDDADLEIDLSGLDDDDGLELDFDSLDDDKDAASKLAIAKAYIEVGDNDDAKALLEEVVSEGDDAQISEANELLDSIN